MTEIHVKIQTRIRFLSCVTFVTETYEIYSDLCSITTIISYDISGNNKSRQTRTSRLLC